MRTFERTEQVPGDYRVDLAGFADVAAAKRVAAALRRGGVSDLYLLPPAGTRGPSLSLGVFNDRDHALHRAARVRALGFKPRIRTIVHRQTRRYLEVELPAAASASAALRAAGGTRESRRGACEVAFAGSVIAPAPASPSVP